MFCCMIVLRLVASRLFSSVCPCGAMLASSPATGPTMRRIIAAFAPVLGSRASRDMMRCSRAAPPESCIGSSGSISSITFCCVPASMYACFMPLALSTEEHPCNSSMRSLLVASLAAYSEIAVVTRAPQVPSSPAIPDCTPTSVLKK